MKIVFFSSDNNISSGAFKAEVELIKDLMQKGHDVTLILPYRGSGTKVLKKNNIKYKVISSLFWVCFEPKTFFSILFQLIIKPVNWCATSRIKKFLKANNFDLAVINTAWNGVGGEVAQKLNIPVVWHLREILEVGQHRRFFNKKHSLATINKSEICLPVSNAVFEYYSKDIDNSKMHVVYDGVDERIYYKKRADLFKDKTTHFLLVGRVFKQKGQYLAIKALNELYDYNFDLTIVGHCSNVYKRKLLRMGTNIVDRINFVGVTDSPKQYYQSSDVFMMNSVGEAFGLVTVEAMMSGNVVVSSRCDGGLEIVGNESNGYFYEPNNYLDLKKQLEHILNNKEEAIKKAKLGQQRALQLFSKTRNSEEIEKWYKKIAK